ncbi:MAG TPA: hypothetical protein VGC08_10625 [Pedobacter sp.]|jgi:hypothetical protein
MKRDHISAATKECPIVIGLGKGIPDSTIKSHENDPYILKKKKKAMDLLNRVGLPEEVQNGHFNS